MSRASLTALAKIFVKYRLDIQGAMSCRHGENACFLFHYHKIAILKHNSKVMISELHVLFRLAYLNLHPWKQFVVELGDNIAIDLDAMSRESGLDLGSALFQIRKKPIKQF